MDFLIQNHNVGQYTGYKTRVFAQYFFEISSENDLPKIAQIYRFASENNLPILFISGGTNMLFARDFFDGIVIKNSIL